MQQVRPVKIGKEIIGDGYPAFIIAEMAWSHDGSFEKAAKIIDGAAKAKADAICFHVTSMKDYMVPHYRTGKGRVSAGKESQSIYKYLEKINFCPETWKNLFLTARGSGLKILAMCNDLPSVILASNLQNDGFVISPASLCEENLISEVAKKKKPVFLRIGGAFLGEIERAIFKIKEVGNSDIVLIQGFQLYPTKLEDMNLRFIQTLKNLFSLPVGFADHTDGDSELTLAVPLVALGFGANLIEKHLTYDRSQKGEDFESALNPDEFKKFVKNLREIEKTFGDSGLRSLSEAELNYRQIARKRIVAKKMISKSEKITPDKIIFKRSDEGAYPDEVKFLLGRIVKTDIEINDPITWDKLI